MAHLPESYLEDGTGPGAEHQTVAAGAATRDQGDSRPPYPLLVATFALAPAPFPEPALAAHYSPRPIFHHLLVLKVWLDVDELDDLAKLEEYVKEGKTLIKIIKEDEGDEEEEKKEEKKEAAIPPFLNKDNIVGDVVHEE